VPDSLGGLPFFIERVLKLGVSVCVQDKILHHEKVCSWSHRATVGPFSGLAAQNDAVLYVNTLIGTQRSALGYGGTMPSVTTPFGMTS
jgi:hypothetical protein